MQQANDASSRDGLRPRDHPVSPAHDVGSPLPKNRFSRILLNLEQELKERREEHEELRPPGEATHVPNYKLNTTVGTNAGTRDSAAPLPTTDRRGIVAPVGR